MSKILLATGSPKLREVVEKLPAFTICGDISYKEDLLDSCERYAPDVVLYSESLKAKGKINSIELLKSVKRRYPAIRLVYLSGYIKDDDNQRMRLLSTLVDAGIYDIFHEQSITTKEVANLLLHPKEKSDVTYIQRFLESTSALTDAADSGYKNIIIFSSIKPGSGKSFIAVNVASAIAKYGKRKRDGSPPRVAIIEGDLQTLSVSTLLQLDDKERNLKSALDKVSEVVDKNGVLIGSDEDIDDVRRYVLSCFLPYNKVSNLYGLIGSNLSRSDISKINSYQYYFLIELIVDYFDIVIVDTNSALEHRTTGPLLELANTCFYILDLDYNNVRNNLRYKKELTEFGILHKVKYVLNRDVDTKEIKEHSEKLAFTSNELVSSGFKLEAKIPMVDLSVMYNRTFTGNPLIFDVKPETKGARKELFIIADEIWPIEYTKELVATEPKKKPSFFDRFRNKI